MKNICLLKKKGKKQNFIFRILFELYDPVTQTLVHPAYADILKIPFSERQSIYCKWTAMIR